MQIRKKLKCQELEFYHHQQQNKELQQHNGDIKNAHKLQITKVNKTLSNNTEEKSPLQIQYKSPLKMSTIL